MSDGLDMTGRWEGMTETRAVMVQLPVRAAKAACRKALRAGAKIMAAVMVTNAPVGSGLTRRAIKVRAGKRSRSKITTLASLSSRLFPTGLFYAGWVNYGWIWSRHRRERLKSHDKGKASKAVGAGEKQIPGTHWLERSDAEARPRVRAEIERVLHEEVMKAFKGQQQTAVEDA